MSKKIRIDIIVATESVGGGERVAYDIADCLKESGYDINFWPLLDNQDIEIRCKSKFILIRFILFFWIYIKTLIKLFSKFSKKCPNVVVSVMPTANILLILISPFFSYKLIISEHNISQKNDRIRHLILDFIKARTYPSADAIVAVSEGVSNYLKKLNQNLDIKVIYNYASSIVFHNRQLKEKSKNVIWVGRLDHQKAPDVAIRAFQKSGVSKKGFVLNIIGPGDPSYYQKLVYELKCSKSVIFHGASAKPFAEVNPRLLVFSSRWEGFGLVLLEAINSEIPVIGVAAKSGPDIISKVCNVNRFVVPSLNENDTISELSILIEKELNSSINWNEIELMHKRVATLFGRNVFKQNYFDLVESVL